MSKFIFTVRIEGKIDVEVNAKDFEEAKKRLKYEIAKKDMNRMTDISYKPTVCFEPDKWTTHAYNKVWEEGDK